MSEAELDRAFDLLKGTLDEVVALNRDILLEMDLLNLRVKTFKKDATFELVA